MPRLTNTIVVGGLRIFVLLSKFFFIIFLAKKLSIADFSYWILYSSIVVYATFVYGFEYYNISLRKYITTSDNLRAIQLVNQWTFILFAYFFSLIALIVLYPFLPNSSSVPYFILFSIAILEHITTEFHRIAIFDNFQIEANLILFIKTTVWMLFAYIIFNDKAVLGINEVLILWEFGALASLCYCIFVYHKLVYRVLSEMRNSISPGAVKKYTDIFISELSNLLPFLILALSNRTPGLLDRLLIEHFTDTKSLSAYGYYSAFGNGIQALFDAIIVGKFVPYLFSSEKQHNLNSSIKLIFIFLVSSLLFWILSILLVFIIIPYFGALTQKEFMNEGRSLFLTISISQLIFSLTVILQYYFYSKSLDRELAIGALVYFFASIILLPSLIWAYGVYGAALALGLSATILLLFRAYQLTCRFYKIF